MGLLGREDGKCGRYLWVSNLLERLDLITEDLEKVTGDEELVRFKGNILLAF